VALTSILSAIGFGLLILTLSAFARRLPIPSPILQVGAGLILGLVPRTPLPRLAPDLVFFVFLPPILWAAAYGTSLRDFKANFRSIGLLAVGLVLATTAAVAVASRALFPGLGWPIAIAIGAIVSPPDAIAAEAIITRLAVPKRIITVLAGESLVNDASALVLYRAAVAAAITGVFSWGEGIVRFFIDAGIGVLVGLAVGWVLIQAARRVRDPLAEVLMSLLGPYVAWVIGESLHVSAVLACVAGGLYVRQYFSTAVTPLTRIQAAAVWELVVFLLSALIFILLGAQVGVLINEVPAGTLGRVGLAGLAISLVAIVVRLLWVPAAAWLPRRLSPALRRRDPMPSRAAIFLISWTSMRGIVSLAAALGLPLTLANGQPFPYRAEIILVTTTVIVVTLLLQGPTLAPLIRWLRFPPEQIRANEERYARGEALRHGLEKLEDLADEPWVADGTAMVERLRGEFRDRIRRHRELDADDETECRLRRETLDAERRALVRLRNEGAIADEVLIELEQELDHEAIRLGIGDLR
jgi:CPA1 family monovalent cation:H+ antiporter